MISIIIVTYNNQNDITDCLTSLPWQTMQLDVVCIDNRSSDLTCQLIRTFTKENSGYPLRFISNAYNTGYAEAINQGLRIARGDWICVLGPDTVLNSGTLHALKTRLDSNPKVGVVAPQLLRPDCSIQPSCRRFPTIQDVLFELTGAPRILPTFFHSRWKMDNFDHNSEKMVDQPEATCLLIRKQALDDVGGMDTQFPIFFNDVDWCRRFYLADWTILFTPDAQIIHRQGTSVRQVPSRMIWKSHQGFYRYFRKYSRTLFERALSILFGFCLMWTACLRITALHIGCLKAGMNPKE